MATIENELQGNIPTTDKSTVKLTESICSCYDEQR